MAWGQEPKEYSYYDANNVKWTIEGKTGWFGEMGAYRVFKDGEQVYPVGGGWDSNIKGDNDWNAMITAFENKTGEFGQEGSFIGDTMGEDSKYSHSIEDDFYAKGSEYYASGDAYGMGISPDEKVITDAYFDIPKEGMPELKDTTLLQSLINDYRETGGEAAAHKLKTIIGTLNPRLTEAQINEEMSNIPSMDISSSDRKDLYSSFEGNVETLGESLLGGLSGDYGQIATGMGGAQRKSRRLGASYQDEYADAYDLYQRGIEGKQDANVQDWIQRIITEEPL